MFRFVKKCLVYYDKLMFKDHVYICVKKTSQVCNTILANVHNFGNNILVNLYKTYARPYLV